MKSTILSLFLIFSIFLYSQNYYSIDSVQVRIPISLEKVETITDLSKYEKTLDEIADKYDVDYLLLWFYYNNGDIKEVWIRKKKFKVI